MNYGAHTFYIAAAYGASILAIAGLIAWRLAAFRKARQAEENAKQRAP